MGWGIGAHKADIWNKIYKWSKHHHWEHCVRPMVCPACMQLTFKNLCTIQVLSLKYPLMGLNSIWSFCFCFWPTQPLGNFILFFLFVEYEWHLISILLLDTFYSIKICMIIFYNIYYYISYFILLVLDLRVRFIFPLSKTNVFLLW